MRKFGEFLGTRMRDNGDVESSKARHVEGGLQTNFVVKLVGSCLRRVVWSAVSRQACEQTKSRV